MDDDLLALEKELGIVAPWNNEEGGDEGQNQTQEVSILSSLSSSSDPLKTKSKDKNSKKSTSTSTKNSTITNDNNQAEEGETNHHYQYDKTSAETTLTVPDFSDLDLTKFKSSTERNVWSHRNKIWKQYATTLPRQAKKNDLLKNRNFSVDHFPNTLNQFLGTHHETPISSFRSLVKRQVLRHLLVLGPKGCGKTSMIRAFLKDYFKEYVTLTNKARGRPANANADGPQGPWGYKDAVLWLDGKKKTCSLAPDDNGVSPNIVDMRPLFDQWLGKFGNRREIKRPCAVCVIENFNEAVEAGIQNISRLVVELDNCVRFIFVAPTVKSVQENFRKSSLQIPIKAMPGDLQLEVVLRICKKENIGYDREGLTDLYQHTSNDCTTLIRNLQKTFAKFHYIGYNEVHRTLYPNRPPEKIRVPVTNILGTPFERCKLCTLIPPCQHISDNDLVEKALKFRKTLPRYENALNCREFIEKGCCTLFLTAGHCSLDHPLDFHQLIYPTPRCPLCTLPRNCGQCKYDKIRKKVIKEIQFQLEKKIPKLHAALNSPYRSTPPKIVDKLRENLKEMTKYLHSEIKSLEKDCELNHEYYLQRGEEIKLYLQEKLLDKIAEWPIETPPSTG